MTFGCMALKSGSGRSDLLTNCCPVGEDEHAQSGAMINDTRMNGCCRSLYWSLWLKPSRLLICACIPGRSRSSTVDQGLCGSRPGCAHHPCCRSGRPFTSCSFSLKTWWCVESVLSDQVLMRCCTEHLFQQRCCSRVLHGVSDPASQPSYE